MTLEKAEIPERYRAGWDPEAALWTQKGPGHTPDTMDLARLHPGREAAWRLVAAGLDGLLGRLETGRILRALDALQVKNGPHRGCFRWYAEEKSVSDTNAAFFTGLGLIVLRHTAGDALPAADRAVLDGMLGDLAVWFESELKDLGPRHLRYPNKCLGDLVCAWLLAELNGGPLPLMAARLKQGADYYRNENWGWGEHLSDIYAAVCQYELTALLLFSRALPPEVKSACEALFRDLNALDARFAGGPRVPALRSYSFSEPPSTPAPFLDRMAPWPGRDSGLFAPLAALAHAADFPARYAAPADRTETIDVPCFGGAIALARVTAFDRLGVLSRFPLMEDAEHPDWGLSWQCMPMGYWNRAGAWAYLQWEASDGRTARCHPAVTRHHRRQVQLTPPSGPPVIGQTFGIRTGHGLLALRRMPERASGWTALLDRFRLVGCAARTESGREGDWHVLTLRFPSPDARSLRLACLPLDPAVLPVLAPGLADGLDWNIPLPLDLERSASVLWHWEAGDSLPPLPRVERAEAELRVTGGAGSWAIAPFATAPAWRALE